MRKGTRLIPLTQGKYAIVDACDYEWLMQWKWCAAKSISTIWYATRWSSAPRRGTVSMHREILHRELLMHSKNGHKMCCDHKDHNGLNNTRQNLRVCTYSQNVQNKRKAPNKSSKMKGVVWSKDRRRWMAVIGCRGKRRMIGRFKSELQAHQAYCVAAAKLFGEFACTK